METEAENEQGDKEEGLCVPRSKLRSPRPFKGPGGPNWHQEALLQKARREEVEMRQMLQEVCCSIRLESSLQDLWHKRVQM